MLPSFRFFRSCQLKWSNDVKKGANGDFSGSTSIDLKATGSHAVEAVTVGLQTPTLQKEWEVRRLPRSGLGFVCVP